MADDLVADDLVGLSEIAERVKLSPQAVINWRKRYEDFPTPVATLKAGPVYRWSDIATWLDQPKAEDHPRRPFGWSPTQEASQDRHRRQPKQPTLGDVLQGFLDTAVTEEHVQRILDIADGRWSNWNHFIGSTGDNERRAEEETLCAMADAAEAVKHLCAVIALSVSSVSTGKDTTSAD